MATRFALTPLCTSIEVIVPTARTVLALLMIFACLLGMVGSLHADILVSRYDNNTVERWDDAGQNLLGHFDVGGAGAEGIACIKLSNNKIYVANNTGTIGIYDLNTGHFLSSINVAGSIAALAVNATGTRLYAADATSGNGHIYLIDLVGGSCPPTSPCSVNTPASHDIALGPDGNLYATHFNSHKGVVKFSPTLSSLGTFIPDGQNGLSYAGGMVFDGKGNLWVTNTGPAGANDAIYEFSGPNSLNPPPGTLLNRTPDPNTFPLGMDISPLNPPSPPIDSCKGCIVIAELDGHRISQIDPNSPSCASGSCTLMSFFSIGTAQNPGRPKYVHFTENCCDVGFVEICKLTCLYNPVSGFFNFTVSNSGAVVGPLSVPVNACSPPIQIPSGIVNIKEAQRLGVVLTGVNAYDYDYFGNQINALFSKNLPFTNANVNVVSGDISTETVVGFTNCASGPGQLKVCKVAGSDQLLGDDFTFTATGFGAPRLFHVPAGPPPGGYCVVVGSYPAGTPVLVTEPTGQHGSMVSNISVAPPDRQGTTTDHSVIAVVTSGTTEVTFTDVVQTGGGQCNLPNPIYDDGPVNATTAAWPINFGITTSDTFTVSGTSVSAFCFYAWVSPGDIPQTVEASITSEEFGGTTYFDNSVDPLSCQLTCSAGQPYGGGTCGVSPSHPTGRFNVYACSGSLGPTQLGSGTYWLNLQNAVVPSGNAVYWDENSGPSSASENSVGTIPAESFVIY